MTVDNFIEDRQRLNEFNPVSPTTDFPLDYPVYAADDLTDLKNDFEVRLDEVLTTDYTITATFDDGVSLDCVIHLNSAFTGNVKIQSLRRPRSTAATVQGRGMTAQELSSAFNSDLAAMRDVFDLVLPMRASLLALAGMISTASMPPMIQTLAMGAMSTIGAGILGVIVVAYDSTTAAGPEAYVRVNSAPSHGLKFRSLDRYLADGLTIDNTNGGWFAVQPGAHGLDTRAGGMKFDSNPTGTIGSDNTAAWERLRATGFPLRLSTGYAAFDSPITVSPRQPIVGIVRADDKLAGAFGSALVYRGAGARSGGAGDSNECFMSNAAGEDFATHTFWRNFTVIGTAANTSTWLLRTHSARNFELESIHWKQNSTTLQWDTYGGDETTDLGTATGDTPPTYEGGLIVPSCHQNVLNKRGDKSWYIRNSSCYWETSADRTAANANQDHYLGYGFGIDYDGNDHYLEKGCHFNNASAMVRLNGGLYSDPTTNWENVSAGSATGFGSDSGRYAVILRNKGGSGSQGGLSGMIARICGNINQASVGVMVDAHLNTGLSDCAIHIMVNFRRNWMGDVDLAGNSTLLASGVNLDGSTFVGGYDPISGDVSGDLQEPRVRVLNTWRGQTVTWRGHRAGYGGRALPGDWLHNRYNEVSWRPQVNSTTIDFDGINATIVGATSSNTLANTNFRTAIVPRLTVTSAGGGTDSAELYANQALCLRGDAVNKGGFWFHAVFAFSALNPTARGFIGLTNSLSATDFSATDPSALVQCLGIGFDLGETTYKILRGSSVAGTPIDLGSAYPSNSLTAVFDLQVWSSPFGNSVTWRLERLDTKQYITLNYNNAIPGAAQLLTPHIIVNEGGTPAMPVAIDFMKMRLRTLTNDVFAGNI